MLLSLKSVDIALAVRLAKMICWSYDYNYFLPNRKPSIMRNILGDTLKHLLNGISFGKVFAQGLSSTFPFQNVHLPRTILGFTIILQGTGSVLMDLRLG